MPDKHTNRGYVMSDRKSLVRHALEIGALELVPEGRKLRSGRLSPYFFNSALFKTGQDLAVLAEAYVNTIRPHMNLVQSVYGPPYKGIVIAAAVTMQVWKSSSHAIGFSSSRKEEKKHGEGGIHIGHNLKGAGVAIVDDVITSGGSAEQAHEYVRSQGGFPVLVAIAFDREEKDAEGTRAAIDQFREKFHIPVYSAASVTDLLAVLKEDEAKYGSDIIRRVLAYRESYGA